MTDRPRRCLPPLADIALDRAQGFACALHALGFWMGSFVAGEDEQGAVAAISHALQEALETVRLEFDDGTGRETAPVPAEGV
ncbi:MAG: hypothetical protein Q4G49_07600 [Paracoccus sp. (in: a-proteobacteria)]|nr:hypothetical protein [Paracoccus sp. (in: a-proteobacteria)]